MNVRIQAIHFEISERLTEFVNKKASKIERHYPEITDFDVTMKVVKPETAMNKDVTVRLAVPQNADLVANKVADSFEEALDVCLEALERQLEKVKAKK